MTRPSFHPPRRAADNPFASHRIESLSFRRANLDRPALGSHLEQLGGRGAIVGAEGSGKTTLLRELAAGVGDHAVIASIPGGCPRPWRSLHRQLPMSIDLQHEIFIDGCEQLGAIGWHRLLRRTQHARSLLVTLHRPGRLPTLTFCRPSPQLLHDLVAELAPDDLCALENSLEPLFERHRGNIRLCFRELYDVYAGRAGLSAFPFR